MYRTIHGQARTALTPSMANLPTTKWRGETPLLQPFEGAIELSICMVRGGGRGRRGQRERGTLHIANTMHEIVAKW